MSTHTHTGVIFERGNGLADPGDYVSGDDDNLYRVVRLVGVIHTGRAGVGNHVHAELELADWSDITDQEADDIVCTASDIEEANNE